MTQYKTRIITKRNNNGEISDTFYQGPIVIWKKIPLLPAVEVGYLFDDVKELHRSRLRNPNVKSVETILISEVNK